MRIIHWLVIRLSHWKLYPQADLRSAYAHFNWKSEYQDATPSDIRYCSWFVRVSRPQEQRATNGMGCLGHGQRHGVALRPSTRVVLARRRSGLWDHRRPNTTSMQFSNSTFNGNVATDNSRTTAGGNYVQFSSGTINGNFSFVGTAQSNLGSGTLCHPELRWSSEPSLWPLAVAPVQTLTSASAASVRSTALRCAAPARANTIDAVSTRRSSCSARKWKLAAQWVGRGGAAEAGTMFLAIDTESPVASLRRRRAEPSGRADHAAGQGGARVGRHTPARSHHRRRRCERVAGGKGTARRLVRHAFGRPAARGVEEIRPDPGRDTGIGTVLHILLSPRSARRVGGLYNFRRVPLSGHTR